ncbi:hypothetical protein ACN20G_08120 [Streptomyces sp. BI20]|uniref:hypothetical protein n=1 Tax=Streptomyces sp. BI20 TaxID=3403460 RepID=UPI003C73C7E7
MPTAIAVTSADLLLPAPDRHTPAGLVLEPPGTWDLDRALTETAAHLDAHGHLVVLAPTWLPAETTRRLHAVRAILESDRIALVPTDLPPLGTALLARQLRQLTVSDLSPGVLASAARLLTHYIHAGALLGSVARLDRVPVSLRTHARSWSPNARFVVLAHPVPHLARLLPGQAPAKAPAGGPGRKGTRRHAQGGRGARGTASPPNTLPPGPEFPTHLTFARGNLAGDWVAADLAPAWDVRGVMENPLPADSARWWGTGKLVEFAAAIPDLPVLYQLVASVRRDRCHWCGLELIGDRCGFCAAGPPEREGQGGGYGTHGGRGPGPTGAADRPEGRYPPVGPSAPAAPDPRVTVPAAPPAPAPDVPDPRTPRP